MPNYVKDPNDSDKVVPGKQPDQYYDNTSSPSRCTFTKSPRYVYIKTDMTKAFGFFYGSSASFATLGGADGATGGANKAASTNYDNWGSTLKAGTRLDIHPTAWSGSFSDANKIMFVYKGGLDGGGV